MDNVPQISRIAGTWKHCDGFSEIEFTFAVHEDSVTATVIDKEDEEWPEIYGVEWSEQQLVLHFSVHWSTGRLTKYRVAVGPNPDRVEATVTSTYQELWERQ